MMKIFKLLFLIFLMPINVVAQDIIDVNHDELMVLAVEYSAKADAYNIYCEKESSLATNFIDKFLKNRDISPEKEQEFRDLNVEVLSSMGTSLKDTGAECKDLEFMMMRLEIMRNLKDVSYLLNGIDPESVPGPEIPNLEDLLPKSRAL